MNEWIYHVVWLDATKGHTIWIIYHLVHSTTGPPALTALVGQSDQSMPTLSQGPIKTIRHDNF